MKRQQRKFIVEIKSARRRSTIRPTSIWGDTDLKAHLRDAENEERQRFEAVVRTAASEQKAEIKAPEEGADPRVHPCTADVPAEIDALPIGETSPQLAEPLLAATNTPTQLSKGARVRAVRNRSQVSVTDLAVIEQENLRLKGLLAQRLRQENVQLRAMLDRFR
ncbi:hypothetical protein IB270_29335 [Ensifer sp. ENS05]|uniref:hypothetical protein n=1 Tax=Ensifer sp. ENS05 TaxID=2769277 RepID=UPI0017871FB7|nr:hypothetical protein [Ensifer sp. ENS05]MBD9596939.1 hypothetical protein [Ensifer sp. ENS05]